MCKFSPPGRRGARQAQSPQYPPAPQYPPTPQQYPDNPMGLEPEPQAEVVAEYMAQELKQQSKYDYREPIRTQQPNYNNRSGYKTHLGNQSMI